MAETVDTFNRPLLDLRVSLIDICNFRCTYCMPADYEYKFLNVRERMSHEEIIRFLKLFKSLGVERVRLTGGEPLLRPDVTEIISEISESIELNDLALTTNAQLLAKHAVQLKDAGLKRVTVSLDALDPLIFKQMTGGRGSLTSVLEGIDAAITAGLTPLKINAVLEKGINESEILPLAEFARKKGITVRFIEYMDVGNKNHWQAKEVIASKEVHDVISAKYELEPLDPAFYGEVASHYKFKNSSGGIGLISSVSQPFCSSCTRGRLSAAGHFYTCLFAGQGVDILTPMRNGASDEELVQLISSIWNKRTDKYSEERSALSDKRRKVEMFHIGG